MATENIKVTASELTLPTGVILKTPTVGEPFLEIDTRGTESGEVLIATLYNEDVDIDINDNGVALPIGDAFYEDFTPSNIGAVSNRYITLDTTTSGNVLEITSNSLNAVENNLTYRFKVVPAYSGSPSATKYFGALVTSQGTLDGHTSFRHFATGKFSVLLYTMPSTLAHTTSAVWNPVAGQEYEIEFNVEIHVSTVHISIYIDGILFEYVIKNASLDRPATTTVLNVGNYYNPSAFSNNAVGKFRDIEVFNIIKHDGGSVVDFSADIPRQLKIYPSGVSFTSASSPSVLNAIVIGFIATTNTPTNTQVKFLPQLKGIDIYFNGIDDWIPSDGSLAQSNTASEVVTGLPFMEVSDIGTLIIQVLMQSDDGVFTPAFGDLTYTKVIGDDTPCPVSVIYGRVVQDNCRPMTSASVKFTSKPYMLNNNMVVMNIDSFYNPSTGYFEALVPVTVDASGAELEDAAAKVTYTMTDEDGVITTKKFNILVTELPLQEVKDVFVL